MPTESTAAQSVAQPDLTSLEPTPEEISAVLALFNQGRYADAEQSVRALLARFPTHGFCYKALGAALRQQGSHDSALEAMQKATEFLPNDAEAHYNLAVTLKQLNRVIEAEASYRKALLCRSDFAAAHHGLGEALKIQKRFQEAEISYRQTLKVKPDFIQAFDSLSQLFTEQNDWSAGLRLANQYLHVAQSDRAKSFFVRCVTSANLTQINQATMTNLLRALDEPWCSPGVLTHVGARLVKSDSTIQPLVAKALKAWPIKLSAENLLGAKGLEAVVSQVFLKAMLVSAAICDIPLERFLTAIRATLLGAAEVTANSNSLANTELDFYCALARQCFINEYVYACAEDEAERAGKLRESLAAKLAQGAEISALHLVAVASYFPLHKLPNSEQLLRMVWSDAVRAMLIPLVAEPAAERQLRTTMPTLTTIDGEVSLAVQNMYEENPYPRWSKREPIKECGTVNDYLRSNFKLLDYQLFNKENDFDILVAGCGTGQHSIEVVKKFKDAQVLAIDLSLSSLSYAKRKTQEMALEIDYAQADIMRLAELNKSFDVIESCGVLHHLADPWAGWRVLLSLLRPGGVMVIGLYSEVARRTVVKGREFITQRGYASTPQGIRQCRQDMFDLDSSEGYTNLLQVNDFFSMSDCRDLFFHVQEHRMTLASIDAFLRDNKLMFLGFQIRRKVISDYKVRFPNDPAAIDLDQWQIFENENPDTFIGMYQFWLQKQK